MDTKEQGKNARSKRVSHASFRKILTDEYEQRRARNKSYSLRAFARDIGISAASLTEYLLKKRQMSYKRAQVTANLLQLDDTKRQLIFGADASFFSRLQPSTKMLRHVMEHWYYFPILSLIEMKSDLITVEMISKDLGLRKAVTRDAITLLLQLGMISTDHERGFVATGVRYSIGAFSKKTLPKGSLVESFELAAKFLRQFSTQPISVRRRNYVSSDLSTVVFGIDSSKMSEFKERIAKFRRDLQHFSETSTPDQVYLLSIGFVPLSKPQADLNEIQKIAKDGEYLDL